MTTAYEHVLFCKMVTHRQSTVLEKLSPKDHNKHTQYAKILKEKGWKPYPTSEENGLGSQHGYFGVAYYRLNEKTHTAEVVFAHRGTRFDQVGNIIADIEIAEQKMPAILKQAAFPYVNSLFPGRDFFAPTNNQAFNCEIEGYPITRIDHTGFSLGGFIAGACTAMSNHPETYGTTFDAPGINRLDFDHKAKKSHLKNYVIKPNLVNTCNGHIGDVYHVPAKIPGAIYNNQPISFEWYTDDWGMAPIAPLSSDHSVTDLQKWLDIPKTQKKRHEGLNTGLFELQETINSHNLDIILDYINQSKDVHLKQTKQVYCWPKAKNTFHYDSDSPFRHAQFYTFQGNGWETTLVNFIAIFFQLAKTTGASVAWEMTKQLNDNGEMKGIIGITHERDNSVFYTEQEYLDYQSQLEERAHRRELSSNEHPYQKNISSAQLLTSRRDGLLQQNNNSNLQQENSRQIASASRQRAAANNNVVPANHAKRLSR